MNNEIYGLCVSPGNAKGRVEICSNIDSIITQKQEDIILVIPYLDRDLIGKLNQNIVGVIAETGSIGSHGAGILRELHIPCIVRVNNALSIFHQGDQLRIDESKIEIINKYSPLVSYNNDNLIHSTYEDLNSDRSSVIRVSKTIDCYRPTRKYQRLRFEMLKSGWEESPSFLFGLPKCTLFQDKRGVVFVKNGPRILDICSYYFDHPKELIKISKKRSSHIVRINENLETLLDLLNSDSPKDIAFVLSSAVRHYQELMLYIYCSQYIYDDLIEIFLDIVSKYDLSLRQFFIYQLRSKYVQNSVNSKNHPGISQTWTFPSHEPYVWKGSIDYEPFRISDFPENVQTKLSDNPVLYNDIWSLLQIVPLVYQMAEEFYYTSSSINSYINRCLDIISNYEKQHGKTEKLPNSIFNWSLEQLNYYINLYI